MRKELNDYLYLHIGCQMILEKSGRISTLYGVKPDWEGERDCLSLHDGRSWYLHEFYPYKLILRELVDMNDDERLYMAGKFCYKGQGITEHYTPEGMRYLLRRGFDLFGLIRAGLAVNKKDIDDGN